MFEGQRNVINNINTQINQRKQKQKQLLNSMYTELKQIPTILENKMNSSNATNEFLMKTRIIRIKKTYFILCVKQKKK